jgi:hypothetical protein
MGKIVGVGKCHQNLQYMGVCNNNGQQSSKGAMYGGCDVGLL